MIKNNSDMINTLYKRMNFVFFILIVLAILNCFSLHFLSKQMYWHDKTNIEAMACLEDKDCSIAPVVDYYPPEYD